MRRPGCLVQAERQGQLSSPAKQVREQLRPQKAVKCGGEDDSSLSWREQGSVALWIGGSVGCWILNTSQFFDSCCCSEGDLMTDNEFSFHNSSSSGQHWDNHITKGEGREGDVQKPADCLQLALTLIQLLCRKQLINPLPYCFLFSVKEIKPFWPFLLELEMSTWKKRLEDSETLFIILAIL